MSNKLSKRMKDYQGDSNTLEPEGKYDLNKEYEFMCIHIFVFLITESLSGDSLLIKIILQSRIVVSITVKMHSLEKVCQCDKCEGNSCLSDAACPLIFFYSLEVQFWNSVNPVCSLNNPPQLQQKCHWVIRIS